MKNTFIHVADNADPAAVCNPFSAFRGAARPGGTPSGPCAEAHPVRTGGENDVHDIGWLRLETLKDLEPEVGLKSTTLAAIGPLKHSARRSSSFSKYIALQRGILDCEA